MILLHSGGIFSTLLIVTKDDHPRRLPGNWRLSVNFALPDSMNNLLLCSLHEKHFLFSTFRC